MTKEKVSDFAIIYNSAWRNLEIPSGKNSQIKFFFLLLLFGIANDRQLSGF